MLSSTSLQYICSALLQLAGSSRAWTTHDHASSRRGSLFQKSPFNDNGMTLHASSSSGENKNSKAEVDVSDLGLTLEDLEAPLPSELLQGIATSGYESTSRLSTVQDDACCWTENGDSFDVTLTIPGLRGQPAASLAVLCSKTTVTLSAFGRPVWSCLLKGEVDPDTATFVTEDGAGRIPVVQLAVQKADASVRWGGFIEQIGEDSIL